jgi:hypothetical protein
LYASLMRDWAKAWHSSGERVTLNRSRSIGTVVSFKHPILYPARVVSCHERVRVVS